MIETLLHFSSSSPPYHLVIEGLLMLWIVWLLFRKSYRPSHQLTDKEKEELIADWKPEPLVPETPQDHVALHPKYIDGKMGKYLTIDGKEYLNLSTLNFLGLVGDKRIEEIAKKTIFKYGVGSCGPRGFYGTVDVHLDLEKQLSEFMGCEEAVLYSYGFATIASAIPAYAKRGDVIFCDKGVNFAIQKGMQASRSRIEWFEHNDAEDLERLLNIQAERDKQNPKKAKVTRRFMIVEGIYLNSGQICPLPQLMALKWKYKVRIFIDESVSFGVLGQHGKGITEHYNIPVEDVDMICATLENAIASTGGFCCGRSFVIDHQRLSGLGYCFSASLPPLLAAASGESLTIMACEIDRFDRLRSNCHMILTELQKIFENSKFFVKASSGSPVIHISCNVSNTEDAEKQLDLFVEKAFEKQLALSRARYLISQEAFPVEPSIRVAVNSELTSEETARALSVFQEIVLNLQI